MHHVTRKRRTRAHVDGDRAINAIERIVLDRGFALDRMRVDYGTDFMLHVFEDDGQYIGFLIGQSRARRGLRRNRDGSYSLRIAVGHAVQWTMGLAPFVLVLYDVDRGCAYWHRMRSRDVTGRSRSLVQKSITVRFLAVDTLDRVALDEFRRWVVKT